ncbi:MAG TPA: WYL domain-containing protein [Clostridia bacterium]|nr:WYL domain-containing protein [Clostridia bacterium]
MASSKLKTLYLLDVLREETDEERRMSVPDLVASLNRRGVAAERKGIYRDLDALREHGEDIVQTPTGYYLRKRALDTAEVKLLVSAVQAAYFITPGRSEKLMDKLLSFESRQRAQQMRAQFNMGGVKCENDEVLRAIDLVNLAIAARRQVSFLYVKQDPDKRMVRQRGGERYVVSPYALIWMLDRYYLVANMDGRHDLTHFRLDRMQKARLEQGPWRHFLEVCEYRTRFDPADYARKCVNMFGDKTRLVTLRCENALAGDIFDRFGANVSVSRAGEGYFTAVLNVAAGDGFLAWVAQWGARMEILSPEDVRGAMKRRMEKAAALYR